MNDIFREVDEDLRREQYKAIWSKYGIYIVVVAVLIVVATGGYRGWQYWQARQAAASGDRFVAALKMADDGKKQEAIAALGELAASGHGAYPYFANMRAAAMKTVDGDEFEAAQMRLAFAPVARHAGRVVDESKPPADEPVEQRGLADIRPSDDRNFREACAARAGGHGRVSGG